MSWRTPKPRKRVTPQWLRDLAKHSCPKCAAVTAKKAA